jgi:hypothetical protein
VVVSEVIVSGAGGPYPDHQDCNQVDCTSQQPQEIPPVVKKPFKLPDLKEPVKVTEPEKPVNVEPVVPADLPKIAGGPLTTAQQQTVIKRLQGAAGRVGVQILRSVAPEICEDLVCSEANLFKPLLKTSAPGVRTCSIYTFGGFRFLVSCQDLNLVWLAIALLTFTSFPVGVLVVRKRTKAKVAVRRK